MCILPMHNHCHRLIVTAVECPSGVDLSLDREVDLMESCEGMFDDWAVAFVSHDGLLVSTWDYDF